jgi:hypothetical protein
MDGIRTNFTQKKTRPERRTVKSIKATFPKWKGKKNGQKEDVEAWP